MNRVDNVAFDATPATKTKLKDDLIAFAVADANAKADQALSAIGYTK
jgi:uncharacterized protein YggE